MRTSQDQQEEQQQQQQQQQEQQRRSQGPDHFHACLKQLADEYNRVVALNRSSQTVCFSPSSNREPEDLAETISPKSRQLGKMMVQPHNSFNQHSGYNKQPQLSREFNLQESAQARLRTCFLQMKSTETFHTDTRFSSRATYLSDMPSPHASLPLFNIHRWKEALDPHGRFRLFIECMMILCCIHDAIFVPYSVAWNPRETVETTVLRLVTLIFWWLEMALNFVTGYYKDGVLIKDMKAAALHYLFRFFIIDACINIVDLVTAIMEFQEGAKNSRDFTDVFGAVRILKLSRLARIIVVFNHVQERMKSWDMDSGSFTLVGLGARLVAILFFLNHMICCGWFWIGKVGDKYGDTGRSWLNMHITSERNYTYKKASPTMQYLTALHWSFTQMTPGSMSVVPQNSVERAWNVVCLLIGLFVSSLVISQLSTKMVRVQSMNSAHLQQMDMLTRFLVEQGVPRSLGQRIRRHVRDRTSVKKPLTIDDLPTLTLLPITLRQELCCSLFARSLLSHSLFHSWCITDNSLLSDLCFKALEVNAYARKDDVFVPLQDAKHTLVLRRGEMLYCREIFTSPSQRSSDHPEVSVKPKDWISVIAVFCKWNYVGRLHALEHCDVVSIVADQLHEVLESHPQIFSMTYSYALTYSKFSMVSDAEYANLVDLDFAPARILQAMYVDDRLEFMAPTLASLTERSLHKLIVRHLPARRPKLSPIAHKFLVKELESDSCTLCLNADSQIAITKVLCAVEIVSSSGKLLAQIASWTDGEFVPNVALPATKLRDLESSRAAAERLIREDLPPLGGSIEFVSSTTQEEEDPRAGQFGVRSSDLKTTFLVEHSLAEDHEIENPWNQYSSARASVAGVLLTRMSRPNPVSRIKLIDTNKNCERLFAWLYREEFEQIGSPNQEAVLRHWLSVNAAPRIHNQVTVDI